MKYKMIVVIEDPDTPEGMVGELLFQLTCIFTHDDNQYGNGYWLVIKGEDFTPCHIDLRYNTSFNKDEKEKWLKNWAENYWNGKNGAWKLKSITITKK